MRSGPFFDHTGTAESPKDSTLFSKSSGGTAYTILLYSLSGADHVTRIARYKAQTEIDTNWKGLQIVHKPDHSELRWGRYRSISEAQKDLKKVKTYRTAIGIPLYSKAIIIPLPGRDVGPTEWNLLNSTGAYSVVVAIFYDVPEADYFGRKRNAVAYCKQLREKGEQAYFHHGISQSTVTVGMFGESAVQMVHERDIIRPEIREPRMAEIAARYKYLAVNGLREKQWVINPKTGKPKKVDTKPYPVHVPKRKATQGQ